VEVFIIFVQGEVGSGGKPRREPNPYLEVDLIDPTDPVIFQGELQKYKPGFTGVFVDRWVQVTSKAIRYFGSKPSSMMLACKPLMAVPLIAIKGVERTYNPLPLSKTDKKG
jgi:hypothetical protein